MDKISSAVRVVLEFWCLTKIWFASGRFHKNGRNGEQAVGYWRRTGVPMHCSCCFFFLSVFRFICIRKSISVRGIRMQRRKDSCWSAEKKVPRCQSSQKNKDGAVRDFRICCWDGSLFRVRNFRIWTKAGSCQGGSRAVMPRGGSAIF